jgi:hypothetical protein
MNSGERNELRLKIMLVHLRDKKVKDVGPFSNIQSVGFKDKKGRYFEYKKLPNDFNINNLRNLEDDQLKELASKMGISKSSTSNKSDVYINGKGYSVKSFEAANPALVNHTTRPGFEIACNYMGISIDKLDRIIENYWNLRQNGIITEDVKNSNPNSPFKDEKEYLRPILEYFLFYGSGRGKSDLPADYILDFHDPLNPNTWKILDKKNAVDIVWDRLVFSLRSKKGMESYLKLLEKEKKGQKLTDKEKTKKESTDKWTKFIQGDYRGALHIRAEK